jgi:hypothetical protein
MVKVRGYRRRNGTYVRGHYRSAPATPDFGPGCLACGLVSFWLFACLWLLVALADPLGTLGSVLVTIVFAFSPLLAALAWFGRRSANPPRLEEPRNNPSDPPNSGPGD